MAEQCWFCKQNETEDTIPVSLSKNDEQVSIGIPLCETCKTKQKRAVIGFFSLFAIGVFATIAVSVIYALSGAEVHGMRSGISISIMILLPISLLGIFVAKAFIRGTHFPKYAYEHPDVTAKKEEGYK